MLSPVLRSLYESKLVTALGFPAVGRPLRGGILASSAGARVEQREALVLDTTQLAVAVS